MARFTIHDIFRDNSFLKIVSVTKACPLKFHDRLLYSLLVYLAAKGWQRSQTKLARLLCVDRGTIRRAAHRLAKHGLVESTESGNPLLPLCAKQPDVDTIKWFVPITASTKTWQYSLAYLAVPWPDVRLPDGLSWQGLLVYSFLVGRIRQERMNRAVISAEEMSRILQLDGRMVRRAVGQLEAKLLIESFPGHRIQLDFPDTTLKQQFRIRRKKKKPARYPWDKPWENMTESEIFNFIEDSPNEYARTWRIMRYRGHYSRSEIEVLSRLVGALVVGYDTLLKLYHKAENDHRKNQESGQYLHSTSYKLLLHRLNEMYGPEIKAAMKTW